MSAYGGFAGKLPASKVLQQALDLKPGKAQAKAQAKAPVKAPAKAQAKTVRATPVRPSASKRYVPGHPYAHKPHHHPVMRAFYPQEPSEEERFAQGDFGPLLAKGIQPHEFTSYLLNKQSQVNPFCPQSLAANMSASGIVRLDSGCTYNPRTRHI